MKGRFALIAVVAAFGVGMATPAFAYGPNAPTVTASTTSIGEGGSLTVSGTDFMPNASITIVLHSDPVTLTTTTADATGSFSVVTTIPSDAAPGAHAIVATDTDGDSASTALTVTGTTVPIAADSALPFTGADIAALTGAGAVALGLGGTMILAGRRRRRMAR